MHLNCFKTFAAMLALAMTGTAAIAQENPAEATDVSLSSYEDLINRIDQLERQVKNDGVEDNCCYCQGGYYAVYESVIVTPYFTRNNAVVEDPGGNDDVVAHSFDWDMEYSPRVEFGYLNCEGVGWRARYWHFDHSTNFNQYFDNAQIEPIDDPDIRVNVDDEILDATHSLRLSVLDLEGMMRHTSDDGGSLTGSAGIRYVRMDQTLDAHDLDAQGVTNETIRMRHNFEGLGPTVSGEIVRRFNCSCWGWYLNGRGSLLYGESDINAHQRDATGGNGAAFDNITDYTDQDLMAIYELGMGLDYTSGCYFLRVGLEAQYWANAGSGSAALGRDDDHSPPTEPDMGLLGINVATGVNF